MTSRKVYEFMFISIGMMFCGYILLLLQKRPMFDGLVVSDFLYVPWLIIEILIAFFLEYMILRRKRNGWLFSCVFFLTNFGILIVGRLDNSLIIPQIRWVIVGMIAFFITFRFDWFIKKLLNYKYFLGILCLVLFAITVFMGREVNGVLNCILVGNIRFQPLEFIKILLVFFLASYLGNNIQINSLKKTRNVFVNFLQIRIFLLNLAIFVVSFLLFFIAKDLGNSIVFLTLVAILSYVKTGQKLHFCVPIIFFVLSIVISCFLFSNIKNIFDAWLNPLMMSNDMAKQTVELLFSFENGGIWGVGYTMGYSNLIFEAHINSIFSTVAEEFGLIGIIFVTIIYILFFYQSVSIACNLKRESEIFLAYGVGILFFLQTFTAICAAVNIFPIANSVLPFMSYGGSGMLSGFILLGMLISFSRKESFNE